MAKKSGTQVMEYLRGLPVNEMDNTVSMPAEKRDWCCDMIDAIDQRDEQKQKARKPKKRVVKKATRKAARR